MVSVLESTYQDLQGTALSLHVCFSLKTRKMGVGLTIQLTTNNQLHGVHAQLSIVMQ